MGGDNGKGVRSVAPAVEAGEAAAADTGGPADRESGSLGRQLEAARLLMARGSLDAARAELLRVLHDGVSRPALESLAGSSLLASAAPDAAVRDLLARIDSFPKDALLWFALATAQLRAGDSHAALQSFSRSASLDATDVHARLAWAQLAHAAGDEVTASRVCVEVLRLHPRRADVWVLSGRVAQATGQRDAALTACRTALLLDPAHAEAAALLRSLTLEPAPIPASRASSALPGASIESIRREIRQAYQTNAKAEFERAANAWWVMRVIRPASLWVSPWFVQAGLSPNQVTWLGFALGLVVCALLGSGNVACAAVGSVLYFAQVVLDYVDGNLARYYKTTSHYGKFLDGSTEIMFLALFHVALGLGAAQQATGSPLMLAGIAALGGATGALFVVRTYLELRYTTAVSALGKGAATNSRDGIVTNVGERRRLRADACGRAQRALTRIEEFLRIPALCVAAATGTLAAFVLLSAALVGGACIAGASALLIRGKNELDAFRPY